MKLSVGILFCVIVAYLVLRYEFSVRLGLHNTICRPDLSAQRRRSANLAYILTANERSIHGNEIRSARFK